MAKQLLDPDISRLDQSSGNDRFQAALLAWYDSQRRRLPWREQPSLYRTVVSEFMLQQTQVKTVLPYFSAWLEKFPDFATLARASEAEVLKAWEGLGYYRRARNLHALAKAYVAANPKPNSAATWLSMPGVGPYTAAAIASIAHGEAVAVVDGNLVRILSRLQMLESTFKDNAAAVKAVTPLAEALIIGSPRPGDHNQAMMELGATVCTRAKPQCLLCPVQEFCQAQSTGHPEQWPKLAKRMTKSVIKERLFILHDGQLLLHKIPDSAPRLAGLYELPEASTIDYTINADDLVLTRKRGIANERIEERIYRADARELATKHPELHWVPRDQLDTITLSGPHKKWTFELLKRE